MRHLAATRVTFLFVLVTMGITFMLLLILTPLSWSQAPAVVQTYDGPLVESHAHIVIYASLVEGQGVQYRVDAREGATELTAASYVSSLDRNNIKCTLGFHAIAFNDKQQELLDHATRLLQLYPDRFVLFAEIFRHNPLGWYDATKLAPLLDTGLFSGLGEIQFNHEPLGDGTDTPKVLPNANRFLNIYSVLGDRGLFVMAHPASRQGVGAAVSHDRRVTWIIHGPQVHGRWDLTDADGDGTPDEMGKLEGLLDTHPNLYYTLDFAESLDDIIRIMKGEFTGAKDAGQFLNFMNDNFDNLLEQMVATWKDVIERHPDRFLWGTDMAFPKWQWEDPRVIDKIVEFSRAFIGRLGSPAAGNYAYKNAERLFGGCNSIDIKPGSFPNTINPKSRGNIPVAILSSPRFDATREVDTGSLTFGPTGDERTLAFCNRNPEDINGDGLPDLICHFDTEDAHFQSGDKEGILKGKTIRGRPIERRDSVRVLEK